MSATTARSATTSPSPTARCSAATCTIGRQRVHRRQHRRASVRAASARARCWAACSGITRDVIPFGFAFGPQGRPGRPQRCRPEAAQVHPRRHPSHPRRLSGAVLRRRHVRASGCEQVSAEFAGDPLVGKIVVVHPRRRQAAADDARGRGRAAPSRRKHRHERAAAQRAEWRGPRSPSSAAAAACRSRSPTPPRGAAAASCCSRCAAGPIPQRVAAYPHHWTWMGQFGRFMRLAAEEGCRDVVFIGSVTRPSLWQHTARLRVLRLMPQIVRLYPGRRRSSAVRASAGCSSSTDSGCSGPRRSRRNS